MYGDSPVNHGIPLTGVMRKSAIFHTSLSVHGCNFFRQQAQCIGTSHNTITYHLCREVFSQSRVLSKFVHFHGFGTFRNPNYHCIAIVGMITNTVYFNFSDVRV